MQLALSEELEYNSRLVTDNESDQWYTPPEIIVRVKQVFDGVIDLDPASCKAANEIVGAKHFFTEQDDGLKQDWFGNVFCNPPYSTPKIGEFCSKNVNAEFFGEYHQSIFLLKEGATTGWFRPLRKKLTCYLNERVKFINGLTGKICTDPRSGHCMVYIGPNQEMFIQVMEQDGFAYFPNLK